MTDSGARSGWLKYCWLVFFVAVALNAFGCSERIDDDLPSSTEDFLPSNGTSSQLDTDPINETVFLDPNTPILNQLLENGIMGSRGSCQPPCWYGIVPGVSSIDDLSEKGFALSEFERANQQTEDGLEILENFYPIYRTTSAQQGILLQFFYTSEWRKITAIHLELWGDPFIADISVPLVFESYGTPDIALGRIQQFQGGWAQVWLVFVYSEGVITRFGPFDVYNSSPGSPEYSLCLSNPHSPIYHAELYFIPYLGANWTPSDEELFDLSSFIPLDNLAGISPDELLSLTQDSKNACILLQALSE